MALIDGDDLISGSFLSYQESNRLKNHWRQSDPLGNMANLQPGMVVSDADDEKLHHIRGDSAGSDEILQATASADVTPTFDKIILTVELDALSDPPTEAELAGVFGADPGDGFSGYVQSTDSAARMYHVVFYGSVFYYEEMAAAV